MNKDDLSTGYPKPVRVAFKGVELLGIATASDTVEIEFSLGTLTPYDQIEIDGQLREVTALSHNMQRRGPQPAEGMTGVFSTRVKHRELGHLGPRLSRYPPP